MEGRGGCKAEKLVNLCWQALRQCAMHTGPHRAVQKKPKYREVSCMRMCVQSAFDVPPHVKPSITAGSTKHCHLKLLTCAMQPHNTGIDQPIVGTSALLEGAWLCIYFGSSEFMRPNIRPCSSATARQRYTPPGAALQDAAAAAASTCPLSSKPVSSKLTSSPLLQAWLLQLICTSWGLNTQPGCARTRTL